VTEQYTFTRYALDGESAYMLYDLHSDPEENVNLAGDAAHRLILESLEQKLDEMINRTQ
jgi:hypothetical protein